MTDLTLQEAIAEATTFCSEYRYEAGDALSAADALILNAVVSGELIPKADHKLVVAEVYRQIAEIARIRAEQHADMALNELPENARPREAVEAAFTEIRWAILALGDTDALADLDGLAAALKGDDHE